MPFTESLVRSEARQPSTLAVACKTNPRPRLKSVRGRPVDRFRALRTVAGPRRERSGAATGATVRVRSNGSASQSDARAGAAV